jgi:hypothetical protein
MAFHCRPSSCPTYADHGQCFYVCEADSWRKAYVLAFKLYYYGENESICTKIDAFGFTLQQGERLVCMD